MSNFYSMVSVYRNKIVDVYYDRNGKKHIKKVDFKPNIFTESNEDSKYKTIYGKSLNKKSFDSIKEYKDYVKYNKDLIPLLLIQLQYRPKQFGIVDTNLLHSFLDKSILLCIIVQKLFSLI